MATINYDINYNDDRFKNVESQKQDALNQVNNTYNNMINQSDKFYQDQIDAANKYADTQKQLQQENTDFLIEKVNQQKEQSKKDYIKEQTGAYVDWRKQSNQYGANAEEMAAKGLQNTGYSESSQVSMYNTYQNRVATARESFNRATLEYDNSIKEAMMANNSKLADIAYNALKTQLELSLQGFQYKNTLLETQINHQRDIDKDYYSRWQNVLSQMNTENQLKENIRQYETTLAENKRQYDLEMQYKKERDRIADEQWQKEYNLSLASRYSNGGSSRSSSSSSSNKTYEVNTPYYQGKKNSDCQYGTFGTKDQNGQSYQPNNLGKDSNGNIKYLKSSGKKVGQMFGQGQVFGSSGADLSGQTVWQYGKNYYIWDGSQNQYIQVS